MSHALWGLDFMTCSQVLSTRLRSWTLDIFGVLWILAAGFAVILPALVHGSSLGPFDLLSHYSLSKQPGVVVHNWRSIDQITQMIPWTTLAWTQVHSGHLPLWNPYSLLGTPLAFNWQSAPFSVASLVGYLVPLHLAFTVQVLVTLVVAGTGVYVLGRVLGLGVLGCVMAATVCELSGPYVAWLGWPQVQVMSWAGWLFAAALLVVRGRHPARAISFLAVVVACVIYSGFPESEIQLGLALVVFLVVLLALRTPWLRGSGPVLRPTFAVTMGTVAGFGLGAPLALPGLQLAAHSTRNLSSYTNALPLHSVGAFVFQGFDGLPEASSHWFGSLGWYPTYVQAYTGVIAVVLVLLAVALRRRQPEVRAFCAVAVVTAAFCFVTPLVMLIHRLPFHVGRVQWAFALAPMDFALAVLAGVGADVLVRSHQKPVVRRWVGGGFTGMGFMLLAVWLFGRGDLPSVDAAIRAQSFVWPAIATAVGLTVVGALAVAHRSTRTRPGSVALPRFVGQGAVIALLACETAFLVASGAPVMSSSPSFLVPTSAEVALEHAVGTSVVGCGTKPCWTTLGILPDINVAYHVQEFADYDPSIPRRYLLSWRALTGDKRGFDVEIFSPDITTTTEARQYGVKFLLEPERTPGPKGTTFVEAIGDEELYRVPGAAVATLNSTTAATTLANAGVAAIPVAVTHASPASWKLVTDQATAQELRLRLTNVPGWHGSIDGRPLSLVPFSDVMLEARIPPGHHTIELHYWPTAFTVGIVLAICSVTALSLGLFVPWARRRRHTQAAGRIDLP